MSQVLKNSLANLIEKDASRGAENTASLNGNRLKDNIAYLYYIIIIISIINTVNNNGDDNDDDADALHTLLEHNTTPVQFC